MRTTVLTPHTGEAARLAEPFGISLDDPEKAAKKLARAYKSIVVLKGPETIISDDARTEVYTAGTAALAKAGTGDVLAWHDRRLARPKGRLSKRRAWVGASW